MSYWLWVIGEERCVSAAVHSQLGRVGLGGSPGRFSPAHEASTAIARYSKISPISSICGSLSEFKRRPTTAGRHGFDATEKFDPWFIGAKTDGNCGF